MYQYKYENVIGSGRKKILRGRFPNSRQFQTKKSSSSQNTDNSRHFQTFPDKLGFQRLFQTCGNPGWSAHLSHCKILYRTDLYSCGSRLLLLAVPCMCLLYMCASTVMLVLTTNTHTRHENKNINKRHLDGHVV